MRAIKHLSLAIILSLVTGFGVPRLSAQYLVTTNLFAVADATIRQSTPTLNYGSTGTLAAGLSSDSNTLSRALLKFDLTALPTNVTITNVTLSLVQTSQPAVPGYFFLCPVLTNWTETAATWNQCSPGAPWSAPGGDFSYNTGYTYLTGGPAGTTNQFTDNGAIHGYGLVNDLQTWLGDPAQNLGWLIMSYPEDTAGAAVQFGSRENATAAPVLTITYLVPSTAPVLKALPPTNGQFCFSFLLQPNHGYIIQSIGDLSSTNWNFYAILDPLSIPYDATFCVPLTSTNQFFRVISR